MPDIELRRGIISNRRQCKLGWLWKEGRQQGECHKDGEVCDHPHVGGANLVSAGNGNLRLRRCTVVCVNYLPCIYDLVHPWPALGICLTSTTVPVSLSVFFALSLSILHWEMNVVRAIHRNYLLIVYLCLLKIIVVLF